MYEAILGDWPREALSVFFVIYIALALFAAYATGTAMAKTWHGRVEVVFYCVLLGLANRFLIYALFGGELLSVAGFVVDTAILIATGLIAYRIWQVRMLSSQYPWLYERTGPFSVREKQEA